jgi:hypothetical protein
MPKKAVHKLAKYPKSAPSTCVFDLLKTLFLVLISLSGYPIKNSY